MSMKERQDRAGFTLVELLLVVAILGILATIVVVNVSGRRESAMIQATRTSISAIGGALDLYEIDTGRYPDALDALMKNDGSPNWMGPYIKGAGLQPDAWGTPFSYKRQPEGGYEIRSAGPDLQLGSEDDITN
jgi:general secretion pathway protein G